MKNVEKELLLKLMWHINAD